MPHYTIMLASTVQSVHGRQIHELYRTSHRIYSLYRILPTISSPELGPGTSSPSSCEVTQFSSRRNELFALGKIALLRPFRHIANVDDAKLPLCRSCLCYFWPAAW